MERPIFVVCDRCRAEGRSGEDPFEAFGALLDFDPVPRKTNRADGWDAETQRAFVAALSLTGSARQAARAVGKAQFGADQLRRAEGNEGFLAACEAAMEIASDERSRRLAEGLRAVADEQAGWRPAPPPWSRSAGRRREAPPPEPSEPTEEEMDRKSKVMLELLEMLVRGYSIRLGLERQARLDGRIAEADFYVRQITCLEVSLDMVSGDGMAILRDYRHKGYDLLRIAETPLSRLLDAARRDHWRAAGEPERPEHPPRHLLIEEEDGVAVEPLESTAPIDGDWRSHAEQNRRFDERHEADARAQLEWEARAREEAAAWRARLDAEDPSAWLGGENEP